MKPRVEVESLSKLYRLGSIGATSVRDTLEQAAELLGATVNQFVVQTAYQEAQRVIEHESVIRLSQKDARTVLSLLDNPPKPNKHLKAAVKVFKGAVRA